MPRYAFRCPACRGEFEVVRPMRDAGRPASCPTDGAAGERVFTAPGVLRASPAAAPTGEGPPPRRYWTSPFFPQRARPPTPAEPGPVLPAGSSKPASFRHFGHWHPAGTPPHGHRAARRARPGRRPSKG